jgi:hypothetical protein
MIKPMGKNRKLRMHHGSGFFPAHLAILKINRQLIIAKIFIMNESTVRIPFKLPLI